jgi:hypothetical protein
MPKLQIFVGLQLLHTLDMAVLGGINYTTNPSRQSPVGAHLFSLTHQTGGIYYDFFVKTAHEGHTMLEQIRLGVLNQQDITLVFEPAINPLLSSNE